MTKSIFIFMFFFSTLLFAIPTVEVTGGELSIKDFDLEYYVDNTHVMKLDEIQKQKFLPKTNKLALGKTHTHAWVRFQIINTTQDTKKIFLHNELGYIMHELNFYGISNAKVTDTIELNLQYQKYSVDYMYGTDAIFDFELKPNELKTVYIYMKMNAVLLGHITIHDEKNSKRRLSKNSGLHTILFGMIVALTLYHLILYISSGYKEYIYYSLYLFTASIWEAFVSGILANNFNFYLTAENQYILISPIIVPIFLVLFAKTIFNTPQKYKSENFFLSTVLILQFILLAIGFFDLYFALRFMTEIFIYMFIILLSTTFSIMKKGNKLASIFLIANSIFAVFLLITDLYYMGIISYSPFAFNSAIIGVTVEGLILAFIIAYRIKLLQASEYAKAQELTKQNKIKDMNKLLQSKVEKELKTSREKDKILFQQSKMISMGEMIENIAHQWRQPLAEINASVLVIDNIVYEKYKDDSGIEKELNSIEHLTSYMSKTIDSFRQFFDDRKSLSTFSINHSLENALKILEKTFANNAIVVNLNLDKKYMIEAYENELQQVLLVILNNAKDALLNKKVQNALISINLSEFTNKYKISISDNAGGIDNAILDKIFDPYFTTKHQTQGTGLGLYISKIIIEDNMHGKISVQNISDGACFEIILKKKLNNG